MRDEIEPQTAELIAEAKATQARARAKGRHDIVREAQAVIDNLVEKDVKLLTTQVDLAEANANLEQQKENYRQATGKEWVDDADEDDE